MSYTPQDDDQHCKFFRLLDSNTCKRGTEIAPIVIAKFKRLENEAMLATEDEKEPRALLEEARERERVAKQKVE